MLRQAQIHLPTGVRARMLWLTQDFARPAAGEGLACCNLYRGGIG